MRQLGHKSSILFSSAAYIKILEQHLYNLVFKWNSVLLMWFWFVIGTWRRTFFYTMSYLAIPYSSKHMADKHA